MRRCKRCLYPDSKPDLYFDSEGVCSACRNFENRPNIDWGARKQELELILENGKNASGYDCIVPSSGGKDSHYQVITLLEMGVTPLVVTASTDYLTPIGRENIDNLARYATTIEVTPNRYVRSKLCRLGLELVGDVSWPEHASIFSVPFRMAVALGIKLVFYGEAPQMEYGGPLGSEMARTMTRRWVGEYGGLCGLRPSDFVGMYGITETDMKDYMLPSDGDMDKVSAYWLGQFLPWDSERNMKIAAEHGMQQYWPSKANWWKAENLDNLATGVHDFTMWLKFGYGRATAQLSVDIRNGRISRGEALERVTDYDGMFPFAYGGIPLDSLLNFMDMSRDEFIEICNKFMNRDLFVENRIEWGQQLTLREET